MDSQLYNYRANLVRVIDGDTIVVKLDLGLKFHIDNFKIRLARINAPEMNTDEGKVAKQVICDMLNEKEIIVETLSDKTDKYGRYLGEIYIKEKDAWININDCMISTGNAVSYRGSIKRQLKPFKN